MFVKNNVRHCWCLVCEAKRCKRHQQLIRIEVCWLRKPTKAGKGKEKV